MSAEGTVVAAGLPVSIGEGPIVRLQQQIIETGSAGWLRSDLLPSCTTDESSAVTVDECAVGDWVGALVSRSTKALMSSRRPSVF